MKKNPFKKINIIIISIFFIGVFFNFNTAFATYESAIQLELTIENNIANIVPASVQTGISGLQVCNVIIAGYRGTFPDESTPVAFYIACYLGSGTSVLNIENAYGALGDGDYWSVSDGYFNVPPYSVEDFYYLQLNRTGGVWTTSPSTPETCTDGIQNQNETGIDVGGVCGYPDPTCTDGIQNQNETGIDVGGVCFYVSLNWPQNATQVPDFEKWTVAYYGNDANETSPTLQKGVMWGESANVLATCLDYPSITATYSTCFDVSMPIHIDYGLPVWVSASDYVSYLTKIGTMTAGKTYFARAVLYSIDDNTLTRTDLISYSDVISFTIDNATGTGGDSGKCAVTDLSCIFTTVLRYVFLPSQNSLEKFGDFKTLLEQKAPFGYAILIYQEVTTLHYDANSTVLQLEQIPQITTLIFSPLRTGLAWLFWFMFAFFLIKRFKDINI